MGRVSKCRALGGLGYLVIGFGPARVLRRVPDPSLKGAVELQELDNEVKSKAKQQKTKVLGMWPMLSYQLFVYIF